MSEGHAIKTDRASDIKPERPLWAWQQRIPLGAVTLLAGEPGLGKSQLGCWLAARLSRGELPGFLEGFPSSTIIASAEDGIAQVVRPRLDAAGAETHYVHIVRGDFSLEHAHSLAQLVEKVSAQLIIIDPLIAYIPMESNTHRDHHVRLLMGPLAAMAEERQVALLGVVHLSKTDSGSPLNRIGGSVGFGAAARSVLLFGRDPDDVDRGPNRVLAHIKSSYGREASSLALRIEQRLIDHSDGGYIETSRLVHVGDSEVTGSDLVETRSAEDAPALKEAGLFLVEMLKDEDVAATEVQKAAASNCIARGTLERAKRLLGVRSVRPGGKGPWLWHLPAIPPPAEA